jgi:hypothetical protein
MAAPNKPESTAKQDEQAAERGRISRLMNLLLLK